MFEIFLCSSLQYSIQYHSSGPLKKKTHRQKGKENCSHIYDPCEKVYAILKNRSVEKNNCGRTTKKQESKEGGESRRCFLSCVHFTIMFYFISEPHRQHDH